MKRLKETEFKRIWGYLFGAIIGFIVSFDFSTTKQCTPSQETRLLQERLSGAKESLEMQIGDLDGSIQHLPRCVK